MAAVKPIPDGYHSIQPYLYFPNAAEAIAFYKNAFAAKVRLSMPAPGGRVMHAELEFGDSVIMLSDEAPERGIHAPHHYGGAPFSLAFYVEDCDAVYHRAIAAGAKSLREPADQFYGDRTAGLEDPYGFQWYLMTHIRDVTAEEMKAAAGQPPA
ncbi:MAG TPA: VOC family protein [Acidobacteriaceae bacterium]|jgi:PhnB protein|nr:VOC family protein [Acidobacteriaceae bacterium]